MTTRQIRKYKKLLEAKRSELIRELREKRDSLAIDLDQEHDPMDRLRRLTEREMAVRDVSVRHALLRKVEGALKEIDVGTFGRCVLCDEPISEKRLAAVPWSPYCVSCQQRAESQGWSGEDQAYYAMAS